MALTLNVNIPTGGTLPWEGQARQYPRRGEPGITYFRGDLADGHYVDCLLYRDEKGRLRGILNHFPTRQPFMDEIGVTHYEEPGNVNLFVRPDSLRKGIALALVREGDKRYRIKFEQQDYTPAGAALVAKLLAERGEPVKLVEGRAARLEALGFPADFVAVVMAKQPKLDPSLV